MRMSEPSSPIAIGGVGGSGTRVVAQLLIDAGFYLGSDLNIPNDNLWFTVLFKRPRWFKTASRESVLTGLDLFRKVMTRAARPTAREAAFLVRAIAEVARHGHEPGGGGGGAWPFVRLMRMITSNRAPRAASAWGWKEPNTHLFLEHLLEWDPRLKFVHVIRHGLDLAYSRNQQQVQNWGWLFSVNRFGETESERARASLDYWIAANRRTIELGGRAGKDRFLLVNLDQLGARPKELVPAILDFVGASVDGTQLARLCALPKVPRTAGRHLQHGLSAFSSEQIDAVRRLGFSVDV